MTTLQEDLSKCQVNGNTIHLPIEPLKDYPALKKALINSGGKYKRSTFIFEIDAQPYVDRIMNGSTNLKKEFQFFPTPAPVVRRMIDEIMWKPNVKSIKMLEPSAGQGHIIDVIVNYIKTANSFNSNTPINSNLEIDCCEIMEENRTILAQKGYRVICNDFMDLQTTPDYDLIIANPPFTKGKDIAHILKMWELLAPGGQLITLSSPGWTFRKDRKHIEFKEFMEDTVASYYKLPAGSFKDSGTNIETMLISMTK